jgi:hypothetical protein
MQSSELLQRLRLSLPLRVELRDPVSGAPFTINRENVLALIIVNVDNLVVESQTVAALFAEMAHAQAAARHMHATAEVQFRKWKAQRGAECRTRSDGKVTDKAVEEFYRSHVDYEARYDEVNRLEVLAALFADLKQAFELKQRSLKDLHGVLGGHTRVVNSEDRVQEMELSALEERALDPMAQAALAAEKMMERSGNPLAPKSGKKGRSPKGDTK